MQDLNQEPQNALQTQTFGKRELGYMVAGAVVYVVVKAVVDKFWGNDGEGE